MKRQKLKKNPLLLFSTLLFCFLAWSWAQAGPKALMYLNVNRFLDVGVLEVETKNLKNLTNTPGMSEYGFDWSPDGHTILFLSSGGKLEVMNADGTGRRVLDFITDEVWGADWSPSGELLALGLKRDNNIDIYTVRLDGSELKRLTDHPAEDFAPVWSPDGSRIAFLSNRKNGNQLYVMSASGGNLIQLTHEDFDFFNASSWSPDGRQIVFSDPGKIGKKPALFIVDSKGQNKPKPLVIQEIRTLSPVQWLPDGRILFHVLPHQIYTADVREEKGVVKGENVTLLFDAKWFEVKGVLVQDLHVQSWFDPAFAPKQAVHPQRKLPVILGHLKAAM